MSGESSGLILVPVGIALAAPVVVGAMAIAGSVLAVKGAVSAGNFLYGKYRDKKEKELRELENSGLLPQLQDAYRSLNTESQRVAEVYHQQAIRTTDDIQAQYKSWYKDLQRENVRDQIQFQMQLKEKAASISKMSRERGELLKKEFADITDAKDRELAGKLKEMEASVSREIKEAVNQLSKNKKNSGLLANKYLENAETLHKLLLEQHQGERFCPGEVQESAALIEKARELLETAPEAAYAVIWKAIEENLVTIEKAEQQLQEWMLQYRLALVLAEGIHAIYENEDELGYLANGSVYASYNEAVEAVKAAGGAASDVKKLTIDAYVFGEYSEQKEAFDSLYERLKEEEDSLSIEELYEIIDDLNILYLPKVREQILEAKLNLNEALLIDQIEVQINDALGGGYHHDGSARGGDMHNGDKHILFVRDNNPEEKICVVLHNNGWSEGGKGQILLETGLDIHTIQDNKISEKKRRQIRERVTGYLNASFAGSSTTLTCKGGTEGKLSTDTGAARLEEVRRRQISRRKQLKRPVR